MEKHRVHLGVAGAAQGEPLQGAPGCGWGGTGGALQGCRDETSPVRASMIAGSGDLASSEGV